MLIQEVFTSLPPDEVLARARDWFNTRFTPFAAFPEEGSGGHVRLELEAGEVIIGAVASDGHTVVRGSTSRLNHELSQFLTTLAPAGGEVRQNLEGPGVTGAG